MIKVNVEYYVEDTKLPEDREQLIKYHYGLEAYLKDVLMVQTLRVVRLDTVNTDGENELLNKGRDTVDQEINDVLNDRYWDRAVQRYADEHNVDADWLHKFLESE